MNKENIDIMENEPVKSAILKLALPTMIAMAVQIIYNLTDMFFIGQTGNPDMVAAITVASPIFMFAQAIGNVFGVGSSSYISRKLGEKEYDEAKHTSAVAIYTSTIAAIVITVLLLIFMEPLLPIIGTSSKTIDFTRDYLKIIAIFAPALVLQVSLSGIVRSEGATRKAMIGMVIGIVINIILDPIFILERINVFGLSINGLGLGTAGAAWATITGNIIGAIYFITHFISKKTILSIKLKDFKPTKKIYGETFKIGIPSAISSLIMSISFILVNILASSYGDYVVAGNGVQMRVASMAFMLIMGMAQGYQPFAGYCYGSKKYDRLISGFKITLLYSTILSVLSTIFFLSYGKDIIKLFIDDVPTIDAGWQFLKAFCIAVPFIGIQVTLMVTFQSTGKALKAMIVSLGRQCIIYIPLLLILNKLFGFSGFIYAQPIADNLTTVIAVILSVSFLKELRTLDNNIKYS